MKIYLAGAGDTPRSIAGRSGVPLQRLLAANPAVVHADAPVRGMKVVIPEAPFQECAEAPDSNTTPSRLWIKTVPLEEMANTEYDAVIVGTGARGGAALWRLCQRWKGTGKRIAVVEAGDPILPTNSKNLSILSDVLAEYFTSLTKPLASPEFRGARLLTALGGRTLLWDAVTPRMHPSVFAHWPMPYSEIEPYYTIAEQAMSVRKCPSATISLVETVLERLCTRGFPETIHTPKALNFEPLGADGQIQSEAYFSSIMFLAKARKLHPFDLAVRTRAARVLTDGAAVRGIEAISQSRQSVFIKAKTVILSASWLPAILLHSGIPGRAIGRYLTNHSFLRRDGNISPKDLISSYPGAGCSIKKSRKRCFALPASGLVYAFLTYKRLVSSQMPPGSSATKPFCSSGRSTFGAFTRLSCGSGQKKPGVLPLFQIIHCL